MLTRALRVQPRRRCALETLESRTHLSADTGGTMGHALFASSYAALHLRPAAEAPRQASRDAAPAAAPSDDVTSDAPVAGLSRADQAPPPEFVDALTVDTDPDGTSAAVAYYRGFEGVTYAATARWDGGPAEVVLVDQPGEFGNEPGVGAVYAQRVALIPGTHTLDLTVTASGGASATTSTTFVVDAPEPAPAPTPDPVAGGPLAPLPAPGAEPSDNLSPDSVGGPGAESAALASAPAVAGVFFDSTAWAPAFRSYLASNGYGDAGFLVPAGAGQLTPLPWSNVNRVSVRFTEPVTVARGDLLVTGVAVAAYGYAAGGFAYDASTFTATWTLDRAVPADKVRLQLRDAVHDADGEKLDGEWADASHPYASGDGTPGGNFYFRANVLPGDANRSGEVNSNDEVEVRARLFKSTASPGLDTPAPYTPFHDIDGGGGIQAQDLSEAKKGAAAGPPPEGEPLAPLDPSVPLDGAPRTRTQYVRDPFGGTVKLRLDSRHVNSAAQQLSTRTNDPVPGPAPLRYTLLNNAGNGGVELTPTDGHWTYTPRFDRSGPDRFRYNVTDGDAVSHPADVVVETTRQPVFANDD